MVKAAKDAATAASGGTGEIGKVVKVEANAAAAKGGEEKSVNGIAGGIKGIVEAAKKAGEEGKLESEAAGGDGGNENAGKLFAKKKNANDGGGDAAAAEKAAAAVSAVSGKQILKAIVDAAKEDGAKKGANVKEATNPIAAAIGSTGDNQNAAAFDKDGMKKNDQIAAAIVLRGMAKDGEFALKNNAADAEKGLKSTVESAVNKTATAANGGADMIGKVVVKATNAAAAKGGDETSVNGIAGGIKGIVEAAEKAGEEGKLESEAVAGGEDNADAGKLFAKKNDEGGGGAADAEKAATAVSAVSGKQILKAIVDAAAKGDGEKKGVDDVKEATNPIEAAIGSTGGDKAAAAFDKMKKNDQIAAAIVLRGMAKDGEFALKNDADNAEKGLKSTVESAVNKTLCRGMVRRDGKSC
ncbi:variable large family protein [Borreliella burgdorferi]|uniref:variable large family protein n=1 Tax=Borreliella burgdorferi TaxID=139 RepID=UPI00031B7494|nr:variable large family protein [Borreliella burgdorferi]